jgi:hypothetical protein
MPGVSRRPRLADLAVSSGFGVRARAAIAAVASIAYVAFFALVLLFEVEFGGRPDSGLLVLVYFVGLNVGLGLLVGRWWAVLVPALPAAMPFLPFAPEPYEGPYVQLAVGFAAIMGTLVAMGVAVRRLPANQRNRRGHPADRRSGAG